jgi:hypothetical protein
VPYISQYEKELIDTHLDKLKNRLSDGKTINLGNFEYVVFELMCHLTSINKCFATMNNLVGVLETSKIEFADKILKPYEQGKLLNEWRSKNKDKLGSRKKKIGGTSSTLTE